MAILPTSVRSVVSSALTRLSEIVSGGPRSGAIREDIGSNLGLGLGIGGGVDPDDASYRRLTSQSRELPPMTQERALRLSWALYETNPLAHGIIETMKDHIVGKGMEVRSPDDDVQGVLDRHWDDPLNNWNLKQHDRVRDMSVYGEGLYVAFVNEADGFVRLASVDPIHIRTILVNPDNPEDLQTVVVNPRRRTGAIGADSDRFYRIIHVDDELASPTYGRLIGANEGDPGSYGSGRQTKTFAYSGSCFYFAINRVTGAVRGRSDLLSIIDWLDAYDQILFNFVDRTLLMNSFVWDVTLKGATTGTILDWRSKHSAAPRPGTVNVHNEMEEWKEVAPKLQQAEFEVQQRTLKAQILSAVGLPPHWFGESQANRSTAMEMGSPALKRLQARQLFFKYVVEFIMTFVVDQAIIAKTIEPPPADAPYSVEVYVPEMSSKNLTQASTSMLNVTQALTIAVAAGFIDRTEAQRIFVTVAQEFGAAIDLKEMLSRMKADGTLDDLDAAAAAQAAANSDSTAAVPGMNNGTSGTFPGDTFRVKSANGAKASEASAVEQAMRVLEAVGATWTPTSMPAPMPDVISIP